MKPTTTPVMAITTAMVAGIMLCRCLLSFATIEPWELLLLMAVWLATLYMVNRRDTPNAFLMAVVLLYTTIGALIFLLKYDSVRYGAEFGSQHFAGIVVDKPQRKAKTWAVRLKTADGGQIMAYLAPDTEPKKGDSIEVFCPFGAEPTCVTDNPDSTFADYHNYLFYSGISATMYSPSGQWRITGHHEPKGLTERLHKLQSDMVSHYAEAGFRGDEGAIIAAMTTGDKSGMSRSLRQQYSRAGVSHVLALSGFHLTIIYTLIELLIITRLPRRKWRIWGRGIVLLILAAFTIMTGSPPSLVRAFIMCAVMIVAAMIQQGNLSMNSLFLAIFLMLASNPMMLFDVGFQLSAMSMLGLTSLGNSLNSIFTIRQRWIQKIWSVICTTVTCTLFTLPLISYYFGYVPVLSLFSNLVVPLLALIMMCLVIAWWILMPVPAIQDLIGCWLTKIVQWMNSFTQWISSMDWAILSFRSTLIGVVLEYILLAVILCIATLIYKRLNPTR